MADRSLSVPVTVSDIERPAARNQIFFRRMIMVIRSVRSLHLHKCVTRFVSDS